MDVPPVVLVLPARNEAATVGAVVRRAPDRVGPHPVVCLVVDDGSTDGTGVVAGRAGARVVRLRGCGLGAAVRAGLAAAVALGPAAVAFCDADGEYAPEELARMVEPVLAGNADYVVGSRFRGTIGRMPPHRRVGNRVLTFALTRLARTPITDGQSGYRALSPAAARAARIIHDYNYAQVLTLDLLARGFRYTEVPISYAFRRHGHSFVRLAPYLAHVVPAIVRQLRTPGELVLDDVGAKDLARGRPGLTVDRAVVAERVTRGPRHRERMVGVVVGEQPLAPEVQQPRQA